MNWININVTTLDSEEFLGADPSERATWLCLLRYCAGQENSGRIEGAKAWKDRKWQQVVRVTLREVTAACDLWEWVDGDLVIHFYPQEKEDEVKRLRSLGSTASEAKRAAAKANGSKGGRPTKNPTETQHKDEQVTQLKTHEKPIELERKGIRKELPPNPQGGIGDGDVEIQTDLIPKPYQAERNMLPGNLTKMKPRLKAQMKAKGNTPLMAQIGEWFGRRSQTIWTIAELEALIVICPDQPQIDGMGGYYLATDLGERDYRRKDLLTLLNNWQGELDRARNYYRERSGA